MDSTKTWVHLTAYQDAAALTRAHEFIAAQTHRPSLVSVIDNSPTPLASPVGLASHPPVLSVHRPDNPGTAGAINATLRAALAAGDVTFLWILDQDSQPHPGLLEALVLAHASLSSRLKEPVGLVAPLTRNRDDGQANVPLRFDRYRSRPVSYGTEPVPCDFLPASGMLLHLPSLATLAPPSERYFLDGYDFALGLAIRAIGRGVWLIPSLELSHQVSRHVLLNTAHGPRYAADMPVFRVQLLHRNTTYLFTRAARGPYRALAAAWQLRRALLDAVRFVRFDFPQRKAKALAALHGWMLGLQGLRPPRPPR